MAGTSMWTDAPTGPEQVALTSALLQDLADRGYDRAPLSQPSGVTSAPYFLAKMHQRLPRSAHTWEAGPHTSPPESQA